MERRNDWAPRHRATDHACIGASRDLRNPRERAADKRSANRFHRRRAGLPRCNAASCSALFTTDIVAVYGSTEAEPIAHQRFDEIAAADWDTMRSGGGLLAGRPIPQIRVDLIEDEIVVAGEHVNKGYLDRMRDAETKLDRGGEIWHRTGDAGRMDDNGRLWLLGRKAAKAGRFFPFTVETAARFWPGVRQAALIPETDPPVLAIVGERSNRPVWAREAEALGGLKTIVLDAIPLDRRHRSKVDYTVLKRLAHAPQVGDR